MKKRIFSLFLAFCMIFSMTTVFASGPEEGAGGSGGYSTEISLEGTATESYTITVPATLENTGIVQVTGAWGTNKRLVISIPSKVTLTNENFITYDADVCFTTGGLNKKEWSFEGNDTSPINSTVEISILCSDISNLFGTFTGTLNYTIEWQEI